MITVTKKDLIELGYGTSFAADIIREAKKLMISKGHTYYQSRKLDRVPREAVEELLGIKFTEKQDWFVLLAFLCKEWKIMAKDPIKKATNGTYYFRANLGYNPVTGKQIQKYRSGFKTKKRQKRNIQNYS